MKRVWTALFFTALLLLGPGFLQADEISDLKKEMEELKARLEILEAEQEDTSHTLQDLVKVSGYGDGEYIMTDKKGDSNSFRVHHLALFFKKQISERWRLFSEIEFEDAPKIGGEDITGNIKDKEGEIFVETFMLEYNLNRYAGFRLGRFLTPGGIWNVEHYPPFVLTQERPQHIRNIFPHLSDGLQFMGSVSMESIFTDYILYAANGQGNTGRGDENENKALGGRVKFALHFMDTHVPGLRAPEIGFSYSTEEMNNKEDARIAGVDLRLHWKGLTLQGEYAKGFYDPEASGIYQRIGYYSQLDYDYKKWTVGYRYDWYDPRTSVDNDRTTIQSIALNYHFTPHVVGKIEHHFVDPQDSSMNHYNKTLLSVAAYFGE